MNLSDDAKHLLACLAYEVRYLRGALQRASGEVPKNRYLQLDLMRLLEQLGYPSEAPAADAADGGWDPPELDPHAEGPAWSVLFERKYLGEAEPRKDTLETYPFMQRGELVSQVQLKFPISVVEWLRLTPQRLPLDKQQIVQQAEKLLEQLEESEDAREHVEDDES